jgi:hypothetical protein
LSRTDSTTVRQKRQSAALSPNALPLVGLGVAANVHLLVKHVLRLQLRLKLIW